jgi:hypothetical protein
MDETLEALYSAEGDLMARAFLYEHPGSFREGVEASMEAVRAMLIKSSPGDVAVTRPRETLSSAIVTGHGG